MLCTLRARTGSRRIVGADFDKEEVIETIAQFN